MRTHPLRRLLAVLLLLSISACTTTGNPREGGFFGWSEEQAKARQETLKRDDEAAHKRLGDEQQLSAGLRGRQDSLTAEAAQLQVQLDRLMVENAGLDAKLRDLMQRRQLGVEQTARLRQVLADNERTRAAARTASTASTAANGRPASAATQLDAVSDQNGRLHREVMILLQ